MPKKRNKGNRIVGFLDEYTVFDLETTGLSTNHDEIIEIGAIKIRDREIVDSFSSLVKPHRKIPMSATKVNGITNEMVADAPIIDDVITEFIEFVGDDVLVGHNITTFDMNFIYDAIEETKGIQFNNDFVDTFYVAKKFLNYDEVENYKLSTLCDFYNVENENSHRAMGDVVATWMCYRRMIVDATTFEIEVFSDESYKNDRKFKAHFSEDTIALQKLKEIIEDVISDNIVSQDEMLRLTNWIDEHEELSGNYPFDVIFESVMNIIEDGIIEEDELEELLNTLKQLVSPVENAEHETITDLTDKHCALTGNFEFGSKSAVERFIEEKGGIIDSSVKKSTNYVIVGMYGSGDWSQGNYGTKVKKAMEFNEKYRDKGVKIEIIQENNFFKEVK